MARRDGDNGAADRPRAAPGQDATADRTTTSSSRSAGADRRRTRDDNDRTSYPGWLRDILAGVGGRGRKRAATWREPADTHPPRSRREHPGMVDDVVVQPDPQQPQRGSPPEDIPDGEITDDPTIA